jgi:hypothetical protein
MRLITKKYISSVSFMRKKSAASVLAGKADVHVQGMYVQEKVDFSFFKNIFTSKGWGGGFRQIADKSIRNTVGNMRYFAASHQMIF